MNPLVNPPLFLNSPPEFINCHYCNSELRVYLTSLYSCTNHKPLCIDYCYFKTYSGKWLFDHISIFIIKHFKMMLEYGTAKNFYVYEWKNGSEINLKQDEGWYLFNKQSYPAEYILSLTPERILAILNLYKTFA